MADEIVESLCRPGASRFVDATLGDGGHSERILDAADPGAQLLALDWDDTAFSVAKRRLERFGDRVKIVRSGFGELARVLEEHGWGDGVDAVIADLGVSSRHLDTAERGFSFGNDGPLDMRMDRRRPESAADLLARVGEKELADIIYEFGEERASRWAKAMGRPSAKRSLDPAVFERVICQDRETTAGAQDPPPFFQ